VLDIVFGSSGQSVPESNLRVALQDANLSGTLYFSYPLFDDVDGQNSADALLVSEEHGLVLFDLQAPAKGAYDRDTWIELVQDRQDEIYRNIQGKLLQNKELMRRRELVVKPEIVTVLPSLQTPVDLDEVLVGTPDNILEIVKTFAPLPMQHDRALNASIQRISTIKPKLKRDNVQTANSYGAIVRDIEKNIANLDAWQKKSAIAYPEGPQRIRGLAGSGKTIVLALKAAYLHARHPDWHIAVTYYSRSLHQQFRDLIRRFMFETKRDEPDWTKIHVMHCWGSKREPGLYSEVAAQRGIEPLTWGAANRRYGDQAFDGACNEILSAVGDVDMPNPLYDAVLIDEAQDLPSSFFKLVFSATKNPRRIVWAYDELQNLGDYSMASPAELFGNDANGNPRVALENQPDRPPQDIILPVCYRNTPWALATAHGLGFGVYRTASDKDATPLVQMFDEPSLWEEIGYECVTKNLGLGNQVSLARNPDCSPDYYSDPAKRLIEPADAVNFQSFANALEQADWIASEIAHDIGDRELLHRDVLIILPNAWTSKSEYGVLASALRKHGIASHLAGVNSSRDEVFLDNSIAVTHIYRAKGNEAPMVYVANSHECYDGLQLAKKRNTLFTAITRSRAWVRVCGCGAKSERLAAEFAQVSNAGFRLDFAYPTVDQIQHIRRIHRDRSESEQRKINKKVSEFSDVIELIRSGELSADSLPEEFLEQLRSIIPEDQ
jgi:superfamily I DNA and RNA helicase